MKKLYKEVIRTIITIVVKKVVVCLAESFFEQLDERVFFSLLDLIEFLIGRFL